MNNNTRPGEQCAGSDESLRLADGGRSEGRTRGGRRHERQHPRPLGYGAGTLRLHPGRDQDTIETDMQMSMGALGLRGIVYATQSTELAGSGRTMRLG